MGASVRHQGRPARQPASTDAAGSKIYPTRWWRPPVKLLHIDSSILSANSVSRALSADIVARQRALNPGLQVIYRDLAAEPPMHLSGAHLAASQGGAIADPIV